MTKAKSKAVVAWQVLTYFEHDQMLQSNNKTVKRDDNYYVDDEQGILSFRQKIQKKMHLAK